MQKWYQIFYKNTGLSPYVWAVLYILPVYFIFTSTSTEPLVFGVVMVLSFFICHVLAFVSKGWLVYFWVGLQIVISILMTWLYSYVYFSLFLAFFIGNIQNRNGFFTLYTIHLVSTIGILNYGFITQTSQFMKQLPFILVSLIGVILLPVTTYYRNKREKLQGQLEDAHMRIAKLVKQEERQRIARDLHDTLGQKLTLIGLKSDLAGKLIANNPVQAQIEMNEVRQTARTALKEVREMVTQMRGTRLVDEMRRIQQMLQSAQIEFVLEGDSRLTNTSLMVENVLSMCLKEAVTNVVKHSQATVCTIFIEPSRTELVVRVVDNGIGFAGDSANYRGSGLLGMKERLEFVNGSMEIVSEHGMQIVMKVPNVVIHEVKEVEM